uniref:Uncharacterized protein n=1 Tax=Rhizophora mucronata TaxID=61149 RepID=A0A2P2N237_RHIMU
MFLLFAYKLVIVPLLALHIKWMPKKLVSSLPLYSFFSVLKKPVGLLLDVDLAK